MSATSDLATFSDAPLRRALLFINLKASQTEACAEELIETLTAGGLEVERGVSEERDGYADCLRAHPECDLVIAAGGDGTVLCLVEAIMEANEGRLPLGIIPLGTANNVARSLGLPLDPTEACGVIAAGESKQMDLGKVNGQFFVSVAGMGLSTKVHEEVAPEHKRRWGWLSYAYHALRLLFRRAPTFRAVIRWDGGTLRARALQITVCNGRYYGGRVEIHPEATLFDGLLDLSLVEGRRFLRGFLKTLLPMRRRHASPGLRLLSSKHFEITTDPAMTIDVEGSPGMRTPAKFEVLPGAVRVFVPGGR